MLLLASPRQAPPPPPLPRIIAAPDMSKGFQTLAASIKVPTEIPPVDLTSSFDPRDYSGVGIEGGAFDGLGEMLTMFPRRRFAAFSPLVRATELFGGIL